MITKRKDMFKLSGERESYRSSAAALVEVMVHSKGYGLKVELTRLLRKIILCDRIPLFLVGTLLRFAYRLTNTPRREL